METTLYPWQEECLEKWFQNKCRGMVQAVTGSGKTLLALTAAHRLEQALGQELYVRIVVPTSALLRQWNQALVSYLEAQGSQGADVRVGLQGGGHKAAPDCRYIIYVINSARYGLARQLLSELQDGKAVLLIADECHHYESGQNRLIFEFLPHIHPREDHFFSLGLSATLPSGEAGRYLASVLGRRIYRYGMEQATAMHTVCPCDIFHICLSFQDWERAEYELLSDRMVQLYHILLQGHSYLQSMSQKDRFEALRCLTGDPSPRTAQAAMHYLRATYARKRLVCLAASRIACVCDLVAGLGLEEKILIFGERIEQAETLYLLLKEKYPGRVGRCHSKAGSLANRNALERFRAGDIRVLISCKSLDEGVDVPDASIGIILSGTSMPRQRAQRLGRIIRRADHKASASLYYLHIGDSSEDACYLPEVAGSHLLELEYLEEAHRFSHPVYDQAAAQVLLAARTSQTDPARMKEILRCLERGSIRADWQADVPALERKIETAPHVRERNYWVCMKKIANRPLPAASPSSIKTYLGNP